MGRQYALDSAARGAAVVVNDIDAAVAEQVVGEIEDAGGRAVCVPADVGTPEGGRVIIEAALDAFGTVDAVINNAGSMSNGYFEDISPAMLEEMLHVHVRGPFFVTQAAWPFLREKGYGRVVMISSEGGLFATEGMSNYAAGKAAVYGLTKALAHEGEPHGILVNAVLPKAMTTIVDAETIPPGYFENAGYPPGLVEQLTELRRAENVSPCVLYLASRACTTTGFAYIASFGRYARVFVGVAPGWVAPDPKHVAPEEVEAHFDDVLRLDGFDTPASVHEATLTSGALLGLPR